MSQVPEEDEGTQTLSLELSLAEAMTVAAALRQYEPYWSPRSSPRDIAQQLTDTRHQISSIVAKLRAAAAMPQ